VTDPRGWRHRRERQPAGGLGGHVGDALWRTTAAFWGQAVMDPEPNLVAAGGALGIRWREPFGLGCAATDGAHADAVLAGTGVPVVAPLAPGGRGNLGRQLGREPLAVVDRELDAPDTVGWCPGDAGELGGFDRPALVIWGLDDRLFPLAHAHRLAALLPDATLEVMEDAGAFVPEDQPRRLAAHIAEFAAGSA
jgi:pimeloyl-ACP methyl ester carboxylesterase